MSDANDADETRSERTWAADKRDFVADQRDDLAAVRDAVADAREAIADARDLLSDERESELNDRERRLNDDSAGHDLSPDTEDDGEAAERGVAAAERAAAVELRATHRSEREVAGVARDEATKRREASKSATGLALAFAQIAKYLHEGTNVDAVFGRIVEVAVSTMPGCAMASVTVRKDGTTHFTPVATDAAALAVDAAQYEHGEGPCLDAVEQTVVYAPSFPDPRWPSLADRPVEHGVHAVASYRLDAPASRPAASLTGSLNAYATQPDGFEAEAREIGLVLAAHASVSVGALREREALEEMGEQLHTALASRDVIAQAKGILMERLRLTPEEAFDVLRRASQTLNVKLREVAQTLTETGELKTRSSQPRRHTGSDAGA